MPHWKQIHKVDNETSMLSLHQSINVDELFSKRTNNHVNLSNSQQMDRQQIFQLEAKSD